MLHLHGRTESSWGARALPHLDEVLLDHAHCEKKAASTALGLIFRYPDYPSLAIPLAELAREELEHFERVVNHIRRRKAQFRRLEPSPYAMQLLAVVRTHEPARAVDTLLCCSLIEARSCDRMQVLAQVMAAALANDDPRVEPPLFELYRDLLASEARHHGAYVELARSLEVFSREQVDRRLHELALHEADVIRGAPPVARLHAAMPPCEKEGE